MRTQILRLTDPDRCPAAVSFDSPSRERALYRRILEVGIRTQLPEDERRLIELCCREGYTVGEAARLLRVDRSTAFRRLCRAKENLRRFAGGCQMRGKRVPAAVASLSESRAQAVSPAGWRGGLSLWSRGGELQVAVPVGLR